MGVHTFDDLRGHVGHAVAVVTYGKDAPVNVAVECEDCNEVLIDFDKDEPQAGKVCTTCGSEDVFYDAYVGVNDENDVRTFDAVFCDNCGGETSLKEASK